MPLKIIRQDITKIKVDAVVNAANTNLLMGGGVCGAIFSAAGAKELQAACDKLSPIATGQAVITPAFRLSAKYIIHTAGPFYDKLIPKKCRSLLFCSYTNSLMLAAKYKCQSIAFPLISSGIYRYPKEEALQVAREAITQFLSKYDMDVYLVIFDKTSFIVSERLIGNVKCYIDENYAESHYISRRSNSEIQASRGRPLAQCSAPLPEQKTAKLNDDLCECCCMMPPEGSAPSYKDDLAKMLSHLDAGFSETLLKLIDKTGKKDSEIYKKANVDRKLFSKIRNNPNYKPTKQTALAFAFALELSLDETKDFISRAGYALTHSSKFDVIIEYFLINKNYNVFELNEVLFSFDLQLIGA